MITLIKALVMNELGQDLVEYALLLTFLALCAIGILPQLGSSINVVFSNTNSALAPGTTGS